LVAMGINDSGQITGWGYKNGQNRAFLMTPVTSNTPPGSNVETTPVDSSGGGTPVTISFGNVTSGGETTLTTTPTGPPPPDGFKIGNPPVYYNLETTAVFSGSATLCINYSGIGYGNENNLKLYHHENGQWVDQTSSLDTANNIICATVTSFSPFAVFETAFNFTGFFTPVDNGILNSMKAGSAIPVKFSLGGNFGLGILWPGFPTSQPITCNGSTVDAVEETVTAGSSSLTYDSNTGQYNYIWKTTKSWTGCRQLMIKLNDGSIHSADFQFMK
jgi:hypothetical protein